MNIIVKPIEQALRRWIREEIRRQINHPEPGEEPLSPEAAASIASSLREVRKGRTHGPFRSADELIGHLRAHRR